MWDPQCVFLCLCLRLYRQSPHNNVLCAGCLRLSRFTCWHLNSQCDGAGADEGGVFLMGWGPWWSRPQRAAPWRVRARREDPACPLPPIRWGQGGKTPPPVPCPLPPVRWGHGGKTVAWAGPLPHSPGPWPQTPASRMEVNNSVSEKRWIGRRRLG